MDTERERVDLKKMTIYYFRNHLDLFFSKVML